MRGLPGSASHKEAACQRRRHKRYGFYPWVEEIPWRRAWQSTPVFLPGESHGQRSLVGYSPWGCRGRHDWSDLSQSSTGGMWTPGEQVFVLPGDWSAGKNLQHQRPGDRMQGYFCSDCAHSDLRPPPLLTFLAFSHFEAVAQSEKMRQNGDIFPFDSLWGFFLVWFLLFVFYHAFRHASYSFFNQGLNPCPLQWKCWVLTTVPPGKSPLESSK